MVILRKFYPTPELLVTIAYRYSFPKDIEIIVFQSYTPISMFENQFRKISLDILKVKDDQIVDGADEPIILQGICLGGWMK